MPQPRGQVFTIRAKVDAYHASDTITQRSRTRSRTTPRMYLNSAPWIFVIQEADKHQIKFLWFRVHSHEIMLWISVKIGYKLRVMGILAEGPSYIYGDNKLVKKHQIQSWKRSIEHHFMRQGVAKDEWRTWCVNTQDKSLSFTRLLPSGEKRTEDGFITMILHLNMYAAPVA